MKSLLTEPGFTDIYGNYCQIGDILKSTYFSDSEPTWRLHSMTKEGYPNISYCNNNFIVESGTAKHLKYMYKDMNDHK